MTDNELIALHGGPTKFALILGMDGAKGVRRVCNWKRRGIPAAIKVAFPDLFRHQIWPELAKPAPSATPKEVSHG